MKQKARFNMRIAKTPVGRGPRPGRLNGAACVRSGFTLIEVMISVALVLMLTYGVAQVFKMSTDTVGAQMTITGIVRDHRAAVTALTEDFRNCVNDSPLFMIDSQVAYDGTSEFDGGKQIYRGLRAGFKNAQEESQAPSAGAPFPAYIKDPTKYEVNGKPFTADFNTYSDRTPRLDRLAFFTRALYRRQTASNTQVFSPTTSTEAYVWYGHTAIPGQANPAKGTLYANGNYMLLPQNQYADDRILGRLAILMADSNTFAGGDSYLGNSTGLAPLDYDSLAFQSTTDLAGATIDQWRGYANPVFQTQGFVKWYYPMNDDMSVSPPKIWRALCQPTLQRPIDQLKLAQTTSSFIPHCTQFIVEYAGDFLAQDATDTTSPGKAIDAGAKMDPATGKITPGNTDGEIDYVIDTSLDSSANHTDAGKWVRRIRWYGLPRDTNDDGKIDITDVLPLADVMDYYKIREQNNLPCVAPWEKVRPNPNPDPAFPAKGPGLLSAAIKKDYLNFTAGNGFAAKNFKYVCAWHNDAPAMIRISMKFGDPSGRLQDGQWYEYILTR